MSDEKPRVGGWGVAIFLLGLLGAAIGYFSTRSDDPRRANHIMKWGLIWTAVQLVVGVVLAAALAVSSVDAELDANRGLGPPRLSDHWHAAYGIYDCDHFIPPLNDVVPDASGLHTHGDGLMHLHPFGSSYTGGNANLGAWGETTGLDVSDDAVRAAGIDRRNGDRCGDAEGSVRLVVWDGPDSPTGRVIDDDLASYAPADGSLWTLAFVPEGVEVPKPPAEVIAALRAPADVPA